MKYSFIKIILAACVVSVTGCKKETKFIAAQEFPSTTEALLKINYLSAYALNPSVQLRLNGERVSGLITGRTPFPGGGYNTNGNSLPDYLKVPAGTNTISVAIPKRNTNLDSVVLFTGTTAALSAGKYYTVHISDTLTNTKMFLAEDNTENVNFGLSLYRFVNMMPNAPFVDLYYNTTRVATGIGYLSSSPYFSMPVPTTAPGWTIRETGTSATSTPLATFPTPTLNTATNQRIYTAFALGYKGSAANNTKPYISLLLTK